MLHAVVTGNVWSTKQVGGMPAGAFLEVRVVGGDTSLVAFDVLGSGIGEQVLVAQGSVAASWFPGTPPPIDALIIGSVDEVADRPGAATPSDPGPPGNQQQERPSRSKENATWPATPSG